MANVNLENWQFSCGGRFTNFPNAPEYQAPSTLTFATHIDLLRFLDGNSQHDTAIQNQVRKRLKEDVTARLWHKQRRKLSGIPNFTKYRTTSGSKYFHDAATAIAEGKATIEQAQYVHGLEQEIKSSGLIVSSGQVLFHAHNNRGLDSTLSYPSVISTSLDPIVCVNHAAKHHCQGSAGELPYIYALTLRNDLPAIWGNGGSLNEWEVLLGTNLSCIAQTVYYGQRFHIIEATIGL